jgi:hypothetical protein
MKISINPKKGFPRATIRVKVDRTLSCFARIGTWNKQDVTRQISASEPTFTSVGNIYHRAFTAVGIAFRRLVAVLSNRMSISKASDIHANTLLSENLVAAGNFVITQG